VPDLAGWRRERLPTIPEEAYFSLAPDWVCEVLSPSTERIDRARKLRIYAEALVAHVWLLNPSLHTLEVLRLRDGLWEIVGTWADAAIVRAEPFDSVELQLSILWDEGPAGGAVPR
jgi:Uma2 family endonuclease